MSTTPFPRRALLFIAPLVLLAPCFVHAEEADVPLTSNAAVEAALSANPSLSAARGRAQAKAALPSQAGALPDPWLRAGPGRAAMNQFTLGITQELPYPGKRGLQAETARREAEASAFEVDESALRLAASVKKSWWRLFYLDRSLDTVARSQEVMRNLVAVAESRYRVGEGLQQDVLRAQMEVAKLLEAGIMLRGEREMEAARFNALLGRPAHGPVILAEVEEAVLPEAPPHETLAARASARRPLLNAQRRMLDAAASGVELARKDYRPDFMLGAEYEWREGEEDMKSVMFGMSLPLRGRRDGALDQRQAEVVAGRHAVRQAELEIEAEVASARAGYERARAQAHLLKTGILPQITQTVASMLAGYQVGKVDFFNLSDTQINLYNEETRYWQVYSEARMALAELAAVTGQELDQ